MSFDFVGLKGCSTIVLLMAIFDILSNLRPQLRFHKLACLIRWQLSEKLGKG
jgi:hypothetical protein